MRIPGKCALAFAAVLTAAACSGDSPTEGGVPRPRADILNSICPDWCNDIDPAPSAPGIFIAHAVTPAYCFNGPFNDIDEDGLRDVCEKLLSYAFRPEIRYSTTYDDVRREPYWVARKDSSGSIWVGYLLSYYVDLGTYQEGCATPWTYFGSGCHNGDSESLFYVLRYNPATEHWIVRSAHYSEHTGWNSTSDTGSVGYAVALEYPSSPGGYARAWVAHKKHANHFTQDGCNGANYHFYPPFQMPVFDWCGQANASALVEWSDYWNIGSQLHPPCERRGQSQPLLRVLRERGLRMLLV